MTNDPDGSRNKLSEAFVTLLAGDFEIEAGRLFAPFGEFSTYFASGPTLEFGETGMEGAVLSYGPSDRFDVGLFAFRGNHRGLGRSNGLWDWGLALGVAPSDWFRFGLGYLSDLAEAGDGLLEAGVSYERRVAGWTGFAQLSVGPFIATAEIVRAMDSFAELDEETDRPAAWNLELAWQAEQPVVLALRLEGSRKLDEAPRRQVGAALLWGIRPNITLTVEYLRGRYTEGFLEDANENDIARRNRLGAKLSIDF